MRIEALAIPGTRVRTVVLAVGLLAAIGCNPSPPADDGGGVREDSGMCLCASDADCDDGVVCNGAEVCAACVCRPALEGLCAAGTTCNETTGTCDTAFAVRESVEQLHVTHAPPGETLELVDASGSVVQSEATDALGSLVFRRVMPGAGYSVRTTTLDPVAVVADLTVMSIASSQPDAAFYEGQMLAAGRQYVVTRDGTTLSAYVTLPGPIASGPYPTVVVISGTDASMPGAPIAGLESSCGEVPALCDAPSDRAALLAAMFGFATVSVNLRGTGCSGGGFDAFETLQLLDGYDVIEAVAAQDWALGHRVGMIGIGESGTASLFVAAQQPPSLAAITPLSAVGSWATTLRPGGIFNPGFADAWTANVLARAQPYGRGWERALVDAGDATCAENQLLHGQRVDAVARARDPGFYDPSIDDARSAATFVDRIDVPVFLAGSWHDEESGPFFTTLLDRIAPALDARLNVYGGVSVDALQPAILEEWRSFLELFVSQRVPPDDSAVRAVMPLVLREIFGTDTLAVGPSRFASHASHADAVAAWRAEPRVRALFESGVMLGEPVPAFERSFATWPPVTTGQRWYFQEDGTLDASPPVSPTSASMFQLDAAAGARGTLAGGSASELLPAYDWRQPPSGSAVVFASTPLATDLVMLGTGSVDLWIRADVDDADVEVTLIEVRPDGQEMYVQSGWLRASRRALDASSTDLWPSPTFEETDAALLVPGEWTIARVAIPGFDHVFRSGSRIRVDIDTPGDSRALWRFDLRTFATPATYAIAHDATHSSSLVLPVLAGATVPSPLPPCPSLRGRPCRSHNPYVNTPAP